MGLPVDCSWLGEISNDGYFARLPDNNLQREAEKGKLLGYQPGTGEGAFGRYARKGVKPPTGC